MSKKKYGMSLSFDVQIAREVGIEAAVVYNQLRFWSDKGDRKDGWVYKSYTEMMDEVPLSEYQLRKSYKLLQSSGIIEVKIMKIDKSPTFHFRFLKNFSFGGLVSEVFKETMVSEVFKETYIDNTEINQNNTRSTTKPEKAGTEDLLNSIILIVNLKEKPTKERLSRLTQMLKDYTAEEIIGAARCFSTSKWHRENKQMSIDNLLSPSKFGRWYAQSLDAKAAPSGGYA